MWKRNLTVMVVPHNRDQMRQVRASRPTVWGLGAALLFGCLALAVVFYALGYFVNRQQETKLLALTSENTVLRKQVSHLQQKVEGLRENVNDLTEMDRKFRTWVNLAEPGDDVRKMGVGGDTTGVPEWEGQVAHDIGERLTRANTDVDQLLREARFLEASFDHIGSILDQNEDRPPAYPFHSSGTPAVRMLDFLGFRLSDQSIHRRQAVPQGHRHCGSVRHENPGHRQRPRGIRG